MLQVENLKKGYGPVTIVEGFSMKVHAGEAVALTGRNGAGKSTVLRCLVGADRPDDGTVTVKGVKVSETNPNIRRDVATVIDDLDFFPDLSVVEHLDLLARAHGLVDPDALVDEVLEEVQLVPQAGQLPSTLSSGQRRRLALATAFVRPRSLLVLDEQDCWLRPALVPRFMKLIAEIAQRLELQVLVISHHPLDLFLHACDRVLTLSPDREAGVRLSESGPGAVP